MARRFTVEGRITGDSRSLRRASDRAQSSLGRLGGFIRDRLVFDVGSLVQGAQALVRGFSSMVNAAAEAEAAQTRLSEALRDSGSAAQSTIGQLNAQAEALERTTRFSAEAVTSQQAFLAELGVAPEQLQTATQATVDLAESFDFSLNEAARNVGRTVGGFAGELGEIIPQLKEFDAEALQAGEGIDFLAERFRGAAAAAGDDLQVQLEQTKEELRDLGVALVEGVTQSGDFNQALERTQQGLRAAEDPTRELTAGLVELVRTLGSVSAIIPDFVEEAARAQSPFLALVESLREAGRESLSLEEPLVLIGDRLVRVSDVSLSAASNIETYSAASGRAAAGSGELTDETHRQESAFEDLSEQLQEVARDLGLVNEQQDRLTQGEAAFVEALEDAGISVRNINEEIDRNEEVIRRARAALRGAAQEDVQVYRDAIAQAQENIRELNAELDGSSEAIGRSSSAMSDAASEAESLSSSSERVTQSQTRLRSQVSSATSVLRVQREEAVRTSAAFNELARAQGRAAAVQATLRAGGTLTLDGTRVRLPGGGSRLTSSPGGPKSRNESRFFPGLSTVV